MDARTIAERELLLQEEMRRRGESDPLRQFKPFPKQKEFLDGVLGGAPLAFFMGANRCGKSAIGACAVSTLARFGHPDPKPCYMGDMVVTDPAISAWVVSLDFASSRDIIQPKMFDNGFVPPGQPHRPFIPPREIYDGSDGWSTSAQILRLKNGSIIGFKSADSGSDKFQGTGKDIILFDEEPPQEIYNECTIRVEAGRRMQVVFTCTLLPPEGVAGGVTWMFQEFVQPYQRKQLEHALLINASIYDNPYILPEELRRLESIYAVGTSNRRIRLDGELLPGISGSRCFMKFNRAQHVAPQLDYYHPRRPLCFCWDFNVEPLASCVGQRDGKIFRVLSEYTQDDGDIEELVGQQYDDWSRHGGDWWIYGDASGQHRSVGRTAATKTCYDIVMNALRSKSVHSRLKVPKTNPLVRDRINAVNRQLKDEAGEINIQIDPSCEELISDFEQVLTDKKGQIKKTTDPKMSYTRRTHWVDGFTYWVAYEAPVEPLRFTDKVFRAFKDPGYAFRTA